MKHLGSISSPVSISRASQTIIDCDCNKTDAGYLLIVPESMLNGFHRYSLRFRAPAAYSSGDAFQLNGNQLTAKTTQGKALSAGAFAANALVVANVERGDDTLYFNVAEEGTGGGGGINWSYDEQDTGRTWVDGSKVFQKTVDLGALPNAGEKRVAHGAGWIQDLITMSGAATNGSKFIQLSHTAALMDGEAPVGVEVEGPNVVVRAAHDASGFTKSHITVSYTKSASGPNDIVVDFSDLNIFTPDRPADTDAGDKGLGVANQAPITEVVVDTYSIKSGDPVKFVLDMTTVMAESNSVYEDGYVYSNNASDFISGSSLPVAMSVRQTASASGSYYVLNDDGEVWSWGYNDNGQLGYPSSYSDLSGIKRIPLSGKAVYIAASSGCFFAALEDGSVENCGTNIYGRLGRLVTDGTSLAPNLGSILRTDLPHNIVKVECSPTRALFLTDTGDVYGCGDGEDGSLGTGSAEYADYTPSAVKIVKAITEEPITHMTTSSMMTVLVGVSGKIYNSGYSVWGPGELVDQGNPNYMNPVYRGTITGTVKKISSAPSIAALVTEDDSLWILGVLSYYSRPDGEYEADPLPDEWGVTEVSGVASKTNISDAADVQCFSDELVMATKNFMMVIGGASAKAYIAPTVDVDPNLAEGTLYLGTPQGQGLAESNTLMSEPPFTVRLPIKGTFFTVDGVPVERKMDVVPTFHGTEGSPDYTLVAGSIADYWSIVSGDTCETDSYHRIAAFTTEDKKLMTFNVSSYSGDVGYFIPGNTMGVRQVPGIEAEQVVCGEKHTLVRCVDGSVMSFGTENRSGELGTISLSTVGSWDAVSTNLGRVEIGEPVVHVAAGGSVSLFVGVSGKVYSCGNANLGALGRDVYSGSESTINLGEIPGLTNIVKAETSGRHSLFLDKNGDVYGCSSNGSLLGGTYDEETGGIQLILSGVKDIACGLEHCIFLLEDGTVKTCGDNYFLQCGRREGRDYLPIGVVGNMPEIVKILAKKNETYLIGSDNKIYAFGLDVYNDTGMWEDLSGYTEEGDVVYAHVSEDVTDAIWLYFILVKRTGGDFWVDVPPYNSYGKDVFGGPFDEDNMVPGYRRAPKFSPLILDNKDSTFVIQHGAPGEEEIPLVDTDRLGVFVPVEKVYQKVDGSMVELNWGAVK